MCNQDTHSNHQHADHIHDDGHDHNHGSDSVVQLFIIPAISLILLLIALYFDHFSTPDWFQGNIRWAWYFAAYIIVALPVLKAAFQQIIKGNIFTEFFLMGIATIGAFAIQEYPEAVAVMLFYAVGEAFQEMAVEKSKSNIKALLDQRPDTAMILNSNGTTTLMKATEIPLDAIIQLKPGEKLALDGILTSKKNSFNTAALTGESIPQSFIEGNQILAGMINTNEVATVRVNAKFEDSKLSKILALVQDATRQKAPTELLISRFAKIYTPIIVVLAVLIIVIPYLFVNDYLFRDWLYRALIFLVISCPCALVISIPLGYFGGIGAASKNGILVKGSNYLDVLANVDTMVMDKTGTLTEGVFKVKDIVIQAGHNQAEIIKYVDAIERYSTHPIATAIHQYIEDNNINNDTIITNVEEIPGYGLKGKVENVELLVGNFKLLDKYNITYDRLLTEIKKTVVAIGLGQQFVGYITIADVIKTMSPTAINELKKIGIKTVMLSGDKQSVVSEVQRLLQVDTAIGDLLPEDKVAALKQLKSQSQQQIGFVGDGVNDAPVIALSDVGIAMGGLGSDAAIETADVVIQDDNPIKLPMAVYIGKYTRKIVWQNISLAFIVKGIVLLLGAGGVATMWEAVFADVGVSFLAILNAIRIQKHDFKLD